MIEQITLTINKPIAQALARFLVYHGYEFRHAYDDQQGIRTPYNTVPSVESRRAWEELINTLEENPSSAIPITY